MKIKILPEDSPKTAMGVIADTFRARADVITSGGVFRTSGWGLHAKEVLSGRLNCVMQGGLIGKCKYMFFDIRDVVSLHQNELEMHPFSCTDWKCKAKMNCKIK